MTHPDTLTIPRAVAEQALKRAYQLGQTYWQQADSDSWTQNKKSDETQVHFNALVTKTYEALQPQAAEGCGEAGCAEGRCGTTECLPSFKAKKAAAEPVAWSNASWLSNPHAGHFSAKKTDCFNVPLYTTPPATQSALTAALSDCRTCQHLSEAWGVCEARPKCVGGEQYVYFPAKQLWDKTPRNDGQAAHQEMREALYAEFNRAVGRQHD